MNVSDIIFEMELAGVDEADIAEIVTLYKDRVVSRELLDEELLMRGYSKIFTLEYEDSDDYYEDSYYEVEKFPSKKSFIDEN